MKKMWPVFVVLFLMGVFLWVAAPAATAQDQCDVVGNSYTMTLDGDEWTLFFVETGPSFSPAPRCAGTVSLMNIYGAWIYDWLVTDEGLTVAEFPAVLTNDELTLYGIPTGLHSLRIGDTVYMTEQEIPLFLFK